MFSPAVYLLIYTYYDTRLGLQLRRVSYKRHSTTSPASHHASRYGDSGGSPAGWPTRRLTARTAPLGTTVGRHSVRLALRRESRVGCAYDRCNIWTCRRIRRGSSDDRTRPLGERPRCGEDADEGRSATYGRDVLDSGCREERGR